MQPAPDVSVTQLSQVGVATLALLVMILFLLVAFYLLKFVVVPLINRGKQNGPAGSATGDNTDSWLAILRDLVEQIRRSVDNQTQLTRLVMQLAEGIKLEIAASEGRVLAAIKKPSDPQADKDTKGHEA